MKSFGAKFKAWDRDFGWTYRTAIFIGLLVALISAPFWIFRSGNAFNTFVHGAAVSQGGSSTIHGQGNLSVSANAQSTETVDQRPLYPYSIIPGGAYSKQELARAVENDPVVARHYANFEVEKTRIVTLRHSQLMYVSYRVGANVFWTKHPLYVPAGETLLTDGKSIARTRCGNRLSVTPAAPVSANEPGPEAMDAPAKFDRPMDAAMPAPQLAILLPPAALFPTPSMPEALAAPPNQAPTGSLISPIPPLVFPIVGGGAPGSPIGPILPPPVATPEPSTIILLLAGVIVVLGLCWKRAHLASKTCDR